MVDHLKPVEFHFIDPSELLPILSHNPLWYQDQKIFGLIEQYVLPNKKGKPEEWTKTREEIKQLFAQALEKEQVFLGEAPEFFNDEDRWTKENFGRNQLVEKDHPNIIVIHHTGSLPETTTAYLNALHLIRLYVPVFRRGIFNLALSHDKNIFPPISSGHLYRGKQTFIGYHYLVRTDGTIEQTLKDDYLGFHAGDYKTNCRSLGIAIVDDLEDKVPSNQAIKAVTTIVKKYNPDMVIGHREVITPAGKPVDTSCPGNLWSTWKPILLSNV